MKKHLIFFLFVCLPTAVLFSQNVGIGTSEPFNKLHIAGNLLVNTPTTATTTSPTGAQTKTMLNNINSSYATTDSTGRIYDPGGPLGSYLSNMISYITIPFDFATTGIEVIADAMQLGTGDSIIIKELSSSTSNLFSAGNGYTTTGKQVFNTKRLYIIFKSNGDGNNGTGFSLLFRRLYDNSSSLPDMGGVAGKAMFFDTKTGSLRSGAINNSTIGLYSTAMGSGTTSSGDYTFATGNGADAIGNYAVAMGSNTSATGNYAVATGFSTDASGSSATAMGNSTNATGSYSVAIGWLNTATGDYSMAFGYNTNAVGNGSFTMGRQNRAEGDYSFAGGKYTDATGYASTAIGDSTLASNRMSFASGFRTIASGRISTAMGVETIAQGSSSTAIGENTTASGQISTAMGYSTTASGQSSTAMGDNTTASGSYSTAMGYNTTASGDYSTAIGSYASTNNYDGSLVIGDHSTTSLLLTPSAAMMFCARFIGGYRFYTSSDLSTGCSLSQGGNAWNTISDRRLKENIEPVNGEDFLKKISVMNLSSWNYKKQNPQTFRHYGPMAQDFYAAFGKDKYGTIGNDTTINQADFDGVNLIAIQALEKRTTDQQQLIRELKNQNTELKVRLDKLEAILLKKE